MSINLILVLQEISKPFEILQKELNHQIHFYK